MKVILAAVVAATILGVGSLAVADERASLVRAVLECRYALVARPDASALIGCHRELTVSWQALEILTPSSIPRGGDAAVAEALRGVAASMEVMGAIIACAGNSTTIQFRDDNEASCEKPIRRTLDRHGFEAVALYGERVTYPSGAHPTMTTAASDIIKPVLDKAVGSLNVAADRFRVR